MERVCDKTGQLIGEKIYDKFSSKTKKKNQLWLENDNNIIFRAGVTKSKVLLTKFRLWCPKSIFNGEGMNLYLNKYLKPTKNMDLSERAP